MKKEYYTKTKEEPVSTFIKEIIERQTYIKGDIELAKLFELISIISNPIEVYPSNAQELSKTSRISKEKKTQEESLNAIGEHTNSDSKQIECSIVNRNSYERLGKGTKSYLIKWIEKSKRSKSKTAQKLILGYSTVHSIIKEYNWYKDNDVEPFSINNEKKRISKESEKVIKNFIWNQKEAFTFNDISKAVRIETNENIKDYILRQHVKKTLKMSYRKWTSKSWMVDVSKLLILRSLFYFWMEKNITASTLLLSLDETIFNHKVANNKW